MQQQTNDGSNPQAPQSRKADGKYKGDNPATPGLNEAWEATDIAEALPKEHSTKYS